MKCLSERPFSHLIKRTTVAKQEEGGKWGKALYRRINALFAVIEKRVFKQKFKPKYAYTYF